MHAQVCTAAGLLAIGHQGGHVRLFQFSATPHDIIQVNTFHDFDQAAFSLAAHRCVADLLCHVPYEQTNIEGQAGELQMPTH